MQSGQTPNHDFLFMHRYEDRRPASNMDPYLVTMLLTCTALQLPLPVHVRHSIRSSV